MMMMMMMMITIKMMRLFSRPYSVMSQMHCNAQHVPSIQVKKCEQEPSVNRNLTGKKCEGLGEGRERERVKKRP